MNIEELKIGGLIAACSLFGYMVLWDFIKQVYCEWKHKKKNEYRCFYWDCPHWRECKYNGKKRRRLFPNRNASA